MRDRQLRAQRVGSGYAILGTRFYVWDEDPCEALAWGVTLGDAAASGGPSREADDPTPDDGLRRSG